MTNFGGGNTSAKLAEPDPITERAERRARVKGSGGDLGSIKADGFSRLYLDALRALEALFAASADEDEMVGSLRLLRDSTPEPARPRSTRRCTPYLPFAAYRPRASGRGDRAGRLLRRRGRDARDLGRRGRLAAVAAAGLRPRPAPARAMWPRAPACAA